MLKKKQKEGNIKKADGRMKEKEVRIN